MPKVYTVLDTETTGLWNWKEWGRENLEDPRFPWPVSYAHAQHIEENGVFTPGERYKRIIRPDGWIVPEEASKIHGITHERAMDEGVPLAEVLEVYGDMRASSDALVGHNLSYDRQIMRSALLRRPLPARDIPAGSDTSVEIICTMRMATPICKMPPTPKMKPGAFKPPRLSEAYKILLGKDLEGAHGAEADADASWEIFMHMRSLPADAAA